MAVQHALNVHQDAPSMLALCEERDLAGADPQRPARAGALCEVLTSGGRTLAQGALARLWACSGRTVPVPGFRSAAQAEENAGALAKGPPTAAQPAGTARVLGR